MTPLGCHDVKIIGSNERPILSYLHSIRHPSFKGNIGTSTHCQSWWILLIQITLLADLPAPLTNYSVPLALAQILPLALAELESRQDKELDELKTED